MIVLSLVAVFVVSTVLTGCQAVRDVRGFKSAKAQFEDFFPQSLCNAPGKHSHDSCYYKLEITNVLSNGQYLGKVPQTVIDFENNQCKEFSPNPVQCPSRGNDKEQGPFTVDGDTTGIKVGAIVEFDSDPDSDTSTSDPDMKKDHLKQRKAK